MKKTIFILLLLSSFGLKVYSQWTLQLSSGLAFETYNDVRIPNETGTLFSFTDDFSIQGPVIPLRLRLGYAFGKNELLGLFAPLSIRYEGAAPHQIRFQQTVFAQGEAIDGRYKFNSYRLTYRRLLLQNGQWTLAVGFTAKIRDAQVRLASPQQSDQKDDLGFVPLLHLLARYQTNNWGFFLEGDGLAGGPGRAFDYLLALDRQIAPSFSIKAGYRIIEGGADVDEVYNFAWLNFVVIGLVFSLKL